VSCKVFETWQVLGCEKREERRENRIERRLAGRDNRK